MSAAVSGSVSIPRLAGPSRASVPGRVASAPSPVRELALFAALGGLGIAQWARLLGDPPVDRLLGALAIACATGAALLWLGRRERRGRSVIAWAVAAIGGGCAVVAVGLPVRMLAPAQWAELGENLRSGLAGIQSASLPYEGADEWLRLTLLLGVPALLGPASALAFWPSSRRDPLRVAALVPLVAIFAIAVTLDDPGAELLWGVALLALVCAWLWIARLRPAARPSAWLTAALAGLVALPLAARAASTELFDYRTWEVFASDREISFDWDHRYGPLEWPRDGTILMTVRSPKALYWKASVLDRFDGIGWQRAAGGDPLAAAERAARYRQPNADFFHRHPEWTTRADVEVKALTSRLAVGFGTPTSVEGIDDVSMSADGTLSLSGEPLSSGAGYGVIGYSPQPTADELRDAPEHYPPRRFAGTTLVGLSSAAAPTAAIAMPLWGERDADAREAVLASPYAATYRLARALVAHAPTPYDAVSAIEEHLRNGAYKYTPDVDRHAYPLASFLFDDRAGYCQQFAGSMALMLRLVGIPARVVSGFAPGSFDAESGVYAIRDLDAHAWVEAYFRGIGWVTFDPTPPAAPASSQQPGGQLAAEAQGRNLTIGNQDITGRGSARDPSQQAGSLGAGEGDAGSAGGLPWAVAGVAALLVAAAAAISAWRRRRRLVAGEATVAQLAELRLALERCGWPLAGDLTLLRLERRFAGLGHRAIAGYAAALRAHLYSPAARPPPGPADRRALRRAISSGGVTGRVRALLAIPPGGPAPPANER